MWWLEAHLRVVRCNRPTRAVIAPTVRQLPSHKHPEEKNRHQQQFDIQSLVATKFMLRLTPRNSKIGRSCDHQHHPYHLKHASLKPASKLLNTPGIVEHQDLHTHED